MIICYTVPEIYGVSQPKKSKLKKKQKLKQNIKQTNKQTNNKTAWRHHFTNVY